MRRNLAALSIAIILSAPVAEAQSGGWTVASTPSVVLGRGDGVVTAEFASITGAARLADGNFVVGNRGDYSMFVVAPDGKVLKRFARSGKGPGEVTFAVWMRRCGDELLLYDSNGDRVHVFAMDGAYVRSFRFASVASRAPYRSACNNKAQFVHYGWDSSKDNTNPKEPYRSMVPVWISPADSGVAQGLGKVAGSERWQNQPLPLGRETQVVISADKVFVGEATSYEIKAFTLDGRPLQPIRKQVGAAPVTPRDVTDEQDRLVAMMGEKFRKGIEQEQAKIPLPKTLPPYRTFVVDQQQHLWVQDYRRSGPGSVRWTVFNPAGRQVAELLLPATLEVHEIGADYVLGAYLDPDESVPEVRLYRLSRK